LAVAGSERVAPERLARLVDGFRGRRVAVLADLGIDEFVHGDIERVSREAPVLVLRHRQTAAVPGGGANAVANLRALGARPLPVGVVGRDAAGEALLGRFRELGVSTASVLIEARYETPVKSRILAGGIHTRRQQVVRIDRGASRGELPAAVLGRLAGRLREVLGASEGLLVADYGYGAATPELVDRVRPGAGCVARPITVDSRNRVERYARVTACTPNQEELERAVGSGPITSEEAIHAAGRALLRLCATRAVLVTRGALGMSLFEPRRSPVRIPAFGSGDVADVTGAGDTVVAVFALAHLAGATFEEAARLANYAAGLVVMKAGTATVSRAELVAAIRTDLA
jgi:rfaE bifunctional protein kinase chain/domain